MTLDKLKLLKRLVRLSNNLDIVGEFKLAGSIDKQIIKLSVRKKDLDDPDQLGLFDDAEESGYANAAPSAEDFVSESELTTEDFSDIEKTVDETERYLLEEYDFPIYDYKDREEIPPAGQLERMFYLTENVLDDNELSEEEEEEEDTILFPDKNSIDPEAFMQSREIGDSFLVDDHSAEEFFADSESDSKMNFENDSFIESSDLGFDIDSFEIGEAETSFPIEDLDAPSDFNPREDYELFLSQSSEEPDLK